MFTINLLIISLCSTLLVSFVYLPVQSSLFNKNKFTSLALICITLVILWALDLIGFSVLHAQGNEPSVVDPNNVDPDGFDAHIWTAAQANINDTCHECNANLSNSPVVNQATCALCKVPSHVSCINFTPGEDNFIDTSLVNNPNIR